MKYDKAILGRLRRYLLTGIVVIAPVGVTIFVLWWILARLDAILGRIFTAIGIRIPGLGLVVLLLIVVAVGWLAQQAVGRQLINLGRNWLMKFPLTRSIYSAAQQITEQIIGDQQKFFKSCVLVEYPRAGIWAVGFLTGQAASEITEFAAEDSLAVFIPTTPNPTSGYLVFLPLSQVRPLKMTVEEGFKLVISGGAVTPDLVRMTGAHVASPPLEVPLTAGGEAAAESAAPTESAASPRGAEATDSPESGDASPSTTGRTPADKRPAPRRRLIR
jgi:uncharacterized membrane protein